jgi:hypothetical protein
MKYARLIFAIVSTTNIPNALPQSFEEDSETKYQGGHFWTPITPIQGSILYAVPQRKFWLWRAVDQNGLVLEEILQSRRDKRAAKRLLKALIELCPKVGDGVIRRRFEVA